MGLIRTITLIVLIVLFGYFFWGAMKQFVPSDNECLEEIAGDYCEDNGMVFGKIYVGKTFTCKEDERAVMFKTYKFMEDEIKECEE